MGYFFIDVEKAKESKYFFDKKISKGIPLYITISIVLLISCFIYSILVPMENSISLIGEIESTTSTEMMLSSIDGVIEKILVQNNDFVAKGEPLIRLQARGIDTELGQLRQTINKKLAYIDKHVSREPMERAGLRSQHMGVDYEYSITSELELDIQNAELLSWRLNKSIIQSTSSGTISLNRNLANGSEIRVGTPLFSIQSINSKENIIIQAECTPEQAGYIHLGQNARISIVEYGSSNVYRTNGRVGYISDGCVVSSGEIGYRIQIFASSKNVEPRIKSNYQFMVGQKLKILLPFGKTRLFNYLLNNF